MSATNGNDVAMTDSNVATSGDTTTVPNGTINANGGIQLNLLRNRQGDPNLNTKGAPRGMNPIQAKPITRAEAHQAAQASRDQFNKDGYAAFLELASNKVVTRTHVAEVQKAEAKRQAILLEELYARYFVWKPEPTKTADGPAARKFQDDQAKQDLVPSKPSLTHELRKVVNKTVHDATIKFYEKYVDPVDMEAFLEKREDIIKSTTNKIVFDSETGFKLKTADKGLELQSARDMKGVAANVGREQASSFKKIGEPDVSGDNRRPNTAGSAGPPGKSGLATGAATGGAVGVANGGTAGGASGGAVGTADGATNGGSI